MALHEIEQWEMVGSASYAVISFANRHERLEYLLGGTDRDAIIAKTLQRGGVYTDACGGRHFMEIVR
jgi:hypothetical protein